MARSSMRALALAVLLATAAGCNGPRSREASVPASSPGKAVLPTLACKLQAPEHVSLAEPVVPVTFTLHNEGDSTLRVLARHTPLEGMLGDMFVVTRSGQRLEYRGRMVKRGPPEPSEYLELARGDHVRATVDLLEGYDLTQAGRYTVRFTGGEGYTCNELLITRD